MPTDLGNGPPLEIQARVLRDLLPEIRRPNPFSVGDLVQQIDHLSRYKWPTADALAIVASLDVKQGSASSDEAVSHDDMVIAVVVPGGEIARFQVESFRFRLYTGEVA